MQTATKTKTKAKVAVKGKAPPKKVVAKRATGTALAVHRPQPPAQPKTMLQVLMEAVRDPKCDAEKMQAIIDVQERLEQREAKRSFNAAFIALQADLPSIRQDGKIEIRAKDNKGERTGVVQQATPYATFNSIMKTIKPLLEKHGFALSFSTEPSADRLLVRGVLEGHGAERTTSFPLPAETSGSKNNVQGWGSSLSYGKRYCTISLLNIISEAKEDRDTDGHQGTFKPAKGGGFAEVIEDKPITAAQRDVIITKITDAKISEQNFCTRYGVDQVGLLPSSLYDAAVKAIDDYKAEKARG